MSGFRHGYSVVLAFQSYHSCSLACSTKQTQLLVQSVHFSIQTSCVLQITNIYIYIYIYIFILNHRLGRALRVFTPLTCHLNRLFGFYQRGTRIRPTMDFGSTCWALGRSDLGGLVGSFTRWIALTVCTLQCQVCCQLLGTNLVVKLKARPRTHVLDLGGHLFLISFGFDVVGLLSFNHAILWGLI